MQNFNRQTSDKTHEQLESSLTFQRTFLSEILKHANGNTEKYMINNLFKESRSHSDFTMKLLDFDWFLEKYADIYDSAKYLTEQTEEATTRYSEVLLRTIQYNNVNNNSKNQEKSRFYQDLAFPFYLIKDKTGLSQASKDAHSDYYLPSNAFSTSDFRRNCSSKQQMQEKSSSSLKTKQKQEKKAPSNFEFMRDFLDARLNNKAFTKSYDGLMMKEYANNLQDELRDVCGIDDNTAYMTSYSRPSVPIFAKKDVQEKRQVKTQKNNNVKLLKNNFDKDFEDIYVMEREDIDRVNKKVKV